MTGLGVLAADDTGSFWAVLGLIPNEERIAFLLCAMYRKPCRTVATGMLQHFFLTPLPIHSFLYTLPIGVRIVS